MIVLKEGKGGYGLQPYDDETGKWVEVAVSAGNTKCYNMEDYAKAVLSEHGLWDRFSNMPEERQKAYLDKKIRPAYEKLLNAEIGKLNRQKGVFGQFYDTPEALAEAMPKMFGKEYVDEFDKAPKKGEYLGQKKGYPYVPIGCHLLQKMRYGDVKFNPIDEAEFQQMAMNAYNGGRVSGSWESFAVNQVKAGRNIVIWRGMHYDRADDADLYENVFRGFVDSEDDNPQMAVSLLGGGCFDTVIYMSSQRSYSRGFANYTGHGMLAHAIFDSKDAKVCAESDVYDVVRNCQAAWAQCKDAVKQYFIDNFPDRSKELYSSISSRIKSGDKGFCLMLAGYDALACGQGNGNQLDVLNPGKVYISSQFEE